MPLPLTLVTVPVTFPLRANVQKSDVSTPITGSVNVTVNVSVSALLGEVPSMTTEATVGGVCSIV